MGFQVIEQVVNAARRKLLVQDYILVMTEKDAVKCRAFAADDWWYLAVDAVPSDAFVDWFDEQLLRLSP